MAEKWQEGGKWGAFLDMKKALKRSNFKASEHLYRFVAFSAKKARPPVCRSKASVDLQGFPGAVLGIG